MRHYSVETLSGYLKGDLRVRKATRVSAHLQFCLRCKEHVAHLRHMSTVLASVEFTPIPDHLCTRIEMAIAAEASARVTASPAPATRPAPATSQALSGEASRRDLPERAKPARRSWLRMPTFSSPLVGSLAAAGAAVVIAGGGYELATHLGGSSSSAPSSSAVVPAAGKPVHSGAASSGSTQLMFGPTVPYVHAGHSRTIDAVHTGTDFEAGTLQQQTVAVLGDVRKANLKAASNAFASPYAPNVTTNGISADQLRGCVGKIAAGRDVLLVDVAKYQRKPATVIVVGKQPNGPGVVYVVGPSCSSSNANILTKQDISHL
jgi:hypothetical protein